MTTQRIGICSALAAAMCVFVSCGSETGPAEPTTFSSNASALLANVPAEAFVVAVLDSRKPLWSYITNGALLPNTSDTKAALHKELQEFVKLRLGIDVTKVSAAVGFAIPRQGRSPAAGALVQGVDGTLKGTEVRTHNSVKLYKLTDDAIYAQVGTTLYLGDPVAVQAALDVAGGKAKSLDKGNVKLARLTRRHNGGAFLSVAAHLTDVAEPGIRQMRTMTGIDHVAIRISKGGVRAMAIGEPERMKASVGELRKRLSHEVGNIAEQKERAKKSDAPAIAGIGSILQYHFMKNALSHLEPKISGKQLTIQLPVKLGEDSGVVVGLIGVAAATAIPAFMKYTKKSKNSEVREHLGKLYRAARSYQLMHGRLPPSVGPTPALGSCCQAGGKCQPSLFSWRNDSWRKLGFSVDTPHYYSYSFIRSYDGFTVRANGDLDCDAEYSTFEMKATFRSGSAPSSVPLYREKELE